MPAIIPREIKDSVVQRWLGGLSRRQNAIKHNVGEGSVDNFVRGWMLQHGPDAEYERLRALAVAMSKSGLSIQQCAGGHSVAMIMNNMGIAEEDYEAFISKLCKGYVDRGLSPGILAEQINQLLFFLETNVKALGITFSLSQILETFKAKLDEIKNLEAKKLNLEKVCRELNIEKEAVEEDLGWDLQLREKLYKNGLKKEEVPKFVDAAIMLKERGYNVFYVANKFSKFEEIDTARASAERNKIGEEKKHEQLKSENNNLEVLISQNRLKLQDLDSLRALGFGFAEFRRLRDFITEVGAENDLIGKEAVNQFFKDLETHYLDYFLQRKRDSELEADKTYLNTDAFIDLFPGFAKNKRKDEEKAKSVTTTNSKDVASTRKLEDDSPISDATLQKNYTYANQSYASDMKNKSRHPNHESSANLQHDSPVAENNNGLAEAVKDRHSMGIGEPSNPSLRKEDKADEFLEERLGSHSTPNAQAMQSEEMDQIEGTALEAEGEGDNTLKLLRSMYKRAGVLVQDSGFGVPPAEVPAGSRRPEITRTDDQANQLNLTRDLGNRKIPTQNKKLLKPPRPRNPHSMIRRLKNQNDS